MAALGAWLCFEDEAGFSMTPPTVRTWARRGHTPVIRVRGRSQRRFSIAALACYKQGERSRLVYWPKRHIDHKRIGRRSFTWTDYRDLLIAAHQQLVAPIVLVWVQDLSARGPGRRLLSLDRRACLHRGLAAQGTVTVLTAHRPEVGHQPPADRGAE